MLFEIERQLDKFNTIFSYSGFISYNILSSLSQTLKEELNKDQKQNKELFNVHFIFVELLQNIMNYSTKKDFYNNGGGTCLVGKNDNKNYIISSGNMIDSKNIETLKEKIEKVNKLNKDELKLYHREVRKEGKYAHEKGAGLGIIEIAKKTTKNIEYKITQIDEENSYIEIYTHL